METNETEVVDDGGRHDRRGRRVATAKRREELLAAYDRSGLTQKAFARREGVNINTFVSWLVKRRRWQPSMRTDGVRFAELALPEKVSAAALEVALPGGLVVRGGDAAQVAALIRALRE